MVSKKKLLLIYNMWKIKINLGNNYTISKLKLNIVCFESGPGDPNSWKSRVQKSHAAVFLGNPNQYQWVGEHILKS